MDVTIFNKALRKGNVRGPVFGRLAELRLKEILEDKSYISNVREPKDSDKKDIGDLVAVYNGDPVRIECKSLTSNSICDGEQYTATFHITGSSDSREFSVGSKTVTTTLMDKTETDLDIIAINMFEVKKEWDFAFIDVNDLPSSGGNYPEEIQDRLVKAHPKIKIPVEKPYVKDIHSIFEKISK